MKSSILLHFIMLHFIRVYSSNGRVVIMGATIGTPPFKPEKKISGLKGGVPIVAPITTVYTVCKGKTDLQTKEYNML